MNILPYKLTSTNDQLSSRAGLLTIAQLMQTLQLSEHIDQQFTAPGSNRGFHPSTFIESSFRGSDRREVYCYPVNAFVFVEISAEMRGG